MSCPFKYDSDWGYVACDVRNHYRCVGEDKCPIIKK